MKSKAKGVLSFGLKALFSAGALWFAFSAVDIQQVVGFVRGLSWYDVLLSFVLLNVSQVFSALRMSDYLRKQERAISLHSALWLQYVGAMFNTLLPSSIGGDGYKAWQLSKRFGCGLMPMVHVMLSNRANGLMLLFVLLAALLLAHSGFALAVPYFSAMVLAALAFIALVYSLAAKILWKESIRYQLRSSVYSLLVQGFMLASVYALLLAFDAPSQLDYMILMLLSSVVSLLPISIGGIGLREVLLLHAGPYMHLDPDQAVSFGAVYSLINLSISLIGVAPYLRGSRHS